MKKKIEQVAKWLDIKTNLKGLDVTGVSINTRTLKPGDLFIPFRGEQVNGHNMSVQPSNWERLLPCGNVMNQEHRMTCLCFLSMIAKLRCRKWPAHTATSCRRS